MITSFRSKLVCWARIAMIITAVPVLSNCGNRPAHLPLLGNFNIVGKDTIYPTIADFSFTDQDGATITNQTLSDKIYVADFIFLSCPTICPKMTKELLSVYHAYQGDDRVQFLSHTIDPEHDSVSRLKQYAENLGISSNRWHFLTGNQDSIMHLAEHSYYSTAYPDSTSPGGFTHSGGLLLIDRKRHIRGVYNGTDPQETARLIGDIRVLLKEQY